MKYLSILSLMAAFAAFSTGASAQDAKGEKQTTIVTEWEGESCTSKDCKEAISAAFDKHCKIKLDKDIKFTDLKSLTAPGACDTDAVREEATKTGKCPKCKLNITVTKEKVTEEKGAEK